MIILVLFCCYLSHCVVCFINPLTAGAVHISFLHFLLAHYTSAFKHFILIIIKDKK